ncbi:MAG: hypothetical protein M0Q38_06420 [Bacteroidales bacterium]|jgi:hypothetical protein|nr:hypothetical protein [Bacteroidales bacterium]
MKPKLLHQEAMDYSFKAKQALEQGKQTSAFEFYLQAAKLESQVAEFYFDKPDLEPTRSFMIRSAAFLNIKAGLIEEAKRFIFFGLLNAKDSIIKDQLNNALELAVSFGNMHTDEASREFNYINLLRQRSIHYVLEPANLAYGYSVSLEMIKDFSESYLKSIKAYAISKFKKVVTIGHKIDREFGKEIDKIINPLVTSSAYGSFKFSIANDFLSREGESDDVLDLKANVVTKYHSEIFVNPLDDSDIELIKSDFSEDEINEIFRPLTRIKANSAPYKVGYYDSEDFKKKYIGKIVNKQKQKLLIVKPITQEDIGELESSIIHIRSSADGKVHKTTIRKEEMKRAEFDYDTNQIEPKDFAPIILTEKVLLNVLFTSETGFTISFQDFRIEHTDIEFEKTLKAFYDAFYLKIKRLFNISEKSEEEQRDWDAIKRLIGNPEAIKD